MLDNFYSQSLYSRYHRADLMRKAEHARLVAIALDSGARPARRLRDSAQRVSAVVSAWRARLAPPTPSVCYPSADCCPAPAAT